MGFNYNNKVPVYARLEQYIEYFTLATPLHTLMVHFVKKVNFYFQLIKVVYRQ